MAKKRRFEIGKVKIRWVRKKPCFELVTVLKNGEETTELMGYKEVIDRCFNALVEEIYKNRKEKSGKNN